MSWLCGRYIRLMLFLMYLVCSPNMDISCSFLGFDKPVLRICLLGMWTYDIDDLGVVGRVLGKHFRLVEDGTNYDLILRSVFSSVRMPLRRSAVHVFWVGEPMTTSPRGVDLALGFDYDAAPNYMRFPIYYNSEWAKNIRPDYVRPKFKGPKKFAAFLFSNRGDRMPGNFDGAKARNKFFDILSTYKRVDSGGIVFNNVGGIVPRKQTLSWLSQYKFVIAFENKTYPGYLTEKLFQAYYAGAIPIWYGDRGALRDINEKAIIYAGDFKSLEDLAKYVEKVDKNPELYEKIWREPLINDSGRSYAVQEMELEKRLLAALERKGVIQITPKGIVMRRRGGRQMMLAANAKVSR